MPNVPSFPHAFGALAASVLLSACPATEDSASSDANTPDVGPQGKGDTPELTVDRACTLRQQDVVRAQRPAFTPDFIRWSCADVEGVNNVNNDDRGQEYCEYFAILRTIPSTPDGQLDDSNPTLLGRSGNLSSIDLSNDQLDWLEFNPDELIGSCVFTAWHQDVNDPLPNCELGVCPDLHGVAVDIEHFQMRRPLNSNSAAATLLRDCDHAASEGDPDNPDDPLHDVFFRGCQEAAKVGGLAWRRSDPAICAVAGRLHECGCSLSGAPDLAQALLPSPESQLRAAGHITVRGFHLGGWSSPSGLPPGCDYIQYGGIERGEITRTLVKCDITAEDALGWFNDMPGYCRTVYGDEVVVHVPIPAERISCMPPGRGQYASTCSEQPWALYGDGVE